MLHYVGHGLDEEKEDAGTVQGNTVLKLSKGTLSHCLLAVRVACQTLRQREDSAEDVPSFSRIVLAAGANHVLATEWDVDSR